MQISLKLEHEGLKDNNINKIMVITSRYNEGCLKGYVVGEFTISVDAFGSFVSDCLNVRVAFVFTPGFHVYFYNGTLQFISKYKRRHCILSYCLFIHS